MLRNVTSAAAIASSVGSSGQGARDEAVAALARARAQQADTNAFISLLPAYALETAAEVDRRVAAGEQLPLAGVPVAVKDNICLAGHVTTAASRILENFVPPHSATALERLLAAGAVPVGKANLDEFGMGSSNENSGFGPVRNPHDHTRVPGGSSGGSAAAVAAGVVPLALGTDTGGSVRQPASFCGLLGLKPTYGRLSRWGIMTLAMSFDQVGIIARTTEDVSLALELMAGGDERDNVSVAMARRAQAGPARTTNAGAREVGERGAAGGGHPDLSGMRIGLLADLCGREGNSPGVYQALTDTVGLLHELGAVTETFSLASIDYVAPTYLLLCAVEASSALARFDGMTFGSRNGADALGQERVMQLSRGAGLGPEVRRRVIIGSLALSEENRADYYERAVRARKVIGDELSATLGRFDAILAPTTPSVAWELGAEGTQIITAYRSDTSTVLANLSGHPAISVPGARAEHGLPVGMQFIGRHFGEADLLRIATAFESRYGADFAPIAAGAGR